MKLGIAAIFKNEKPYIVEWLAYHRLMGVDQFFIADNISDDGSTELLTNLDEAGLITRVPFPTKDGKGPQVPAYNQILEKFGSKVDLLAFIDADEFIVPAQGDSIRPALESLAKDDSIGAIGVNWSIYGSSGHMEFMDKPVIERFTYRARQTTGVNRHIKTLVKPAFCEKMLNPHKVVLTKGRYVKASGDSFDFYEKNIHGSSEFIDWEPLRINHYVIKSFDEFKNRKQRRGRGTTTQSLRKDVFFKAHDMNHEPCRIMEQFLEPVKREMQAIEYKLQLLEFRKSAASRHSLKSRLSKQLGEPGRWLDRKLNFTMLPCTDIKIGKGEFKWQSVGNDPAFMLKRRGANPQGWYMLSVKVSSSSARLNGKLYVNYGEGISETTAIRVPLKHGSLVKKVCYFPSNVKSIRFDPATEPCKFDVESFELSKLSPAFARKQIEKKIFTHLGKQETSGVTTEELLGKYELCFHSYYPALSYGQWLQRYEDRNFNAPNINKIKDALSSELKFTLILPVHSQSNCALSAVFESVAKQVYKNYELLVVYQELVKDQIIAAQPMLKQLKVAHKALNVGESTHLADYLNLGLKHATGRYVTVLDANDRMSDFALLFLASQLEKTPDASILYTDEDTLNAQSERVDPNFKSGWNPDLYYAQDYISTFVTFKKNELKSIGGFNIDLDSGYIYDAVLRVTGNINHEHIVRLPHILNHKGINPSLGCSTEAAGLKVRKTFFERQGQAIEVTYQKEVDSYRVKWPVCNPDPLVSLLIPTRDGFDILKQCVESIMDKTTYSNYELIILDNQSRCEKTLDYLKQFDRHECVRVLPFDQPFNYSAINNFGVEHARGSVIGLINNDIEVISKDWLTEMVSHAIRPDIGCVGAKLYYANDTIQHGGVICGLGGVAGHSHKHYKRTDSGFQNRLNCVQNLSAVTAAVLLLRKEVYEQVAGLDEENLIVALNDVDLCLKVREAGYRNLWTPHAELYHHESISRGLDDTPEKKARFISEHTFMREKWKGKLQPDPYYNPNLTLVREDFSLGT